MSVQLSVVADGLVKLIWSKIAICEVPRFGQLQIAISESQERMAVSGFRQKTCQTPSAIAALKRRTKNEPRLRCA